MRICLIWNILVCGLLYVFPVDIKGQACKECKKGISRECESCDVGCYLVANSWCYKCRPECSSCSSRNDCDRCQSGLYGRRCGYDCVSCRHGSCTNITCTDGCADGYYHHEGDAACRLCPFTCVTCNSKSDCTSCIAGRTGSNCQHCNPGHYLKDGKCNQCNINCLHDRCFDISDNCTDGCKDGWSGFGCIDACGPNCVSCDRHNGTVCTSGGTQDTQSSDNVFIIVGAVGSAVMIILIIAAVCVFISHRKRGRNDLETSVIYENYPLDNGPSNVSVTDTDKITKSTCPNNVRVTGTDGITESTAHRTISNPYLIFSPEY